MLQVIFHGVDRSPAMEADIAERLEALKRFDSTIGECSEQGVRHHPPRR